MIDFDILVSIEAVGEAINKLQTARRQGGRQSILLVELEEEVCLETRTLFSRYVDVVLWAEKVDASTFKAVNKSLLASFDSLKTNKAVIKSVRKRYADFLKFSRKHSDKSVVSFVVKMWKAFLRFCEENGVPNIAGLEKGWEGS